MKNVLYFIYGFVFVPNTVLVLASVYSPTINPLYAGITAMLSIFGLLIAVANTPEEV